MPVEKFIVVDVEAAGPNPSKYAMLSIGACLSSDTSENFYAELQPDKADFIPQALEVNKLDMQILAAEQ